MFVQVFSFCYKNLDMNLTCILGENALTGCSGPLAYLSITHTFAVYEDGTSIIRTVSCREQNPLVSGRAVYVLAVATLCVRLIDKLPIRSF